MIDMPLEELRTYRGRNPKPADFEEYWGRALAELGELGTKHELVPAAYPAPGVELYHLYFTGAGRARIHAKLLRPKTRNETPALLGFHGYSGSSGQWTDWLHYCLSGFTVAVLDCRGQGGLSEDTGGVKGNTLHGHIIRGLDDEPEKLLYRNIFLDSAQLARIVAAMPEVDETRLATYGASQGGALSLVCAALEPSIALCFAEFPFLADYKRVWELDMVEHSYGELRQYFRRFDPTHRREEEIFTRLGYIDVQHLAPRIEAETLVAIALMDDRCPPSSQFAVYNKISSKKDMAIYPDFGHELLPGFRDRVFETLVRRYAGET